MARHDKKQHKNILVAAMIRFRQSRPSFACNQTHHSLIRDQEHLEPLLVRSIQVTSSGHSTLKSDNNSSSGELFPEIMTQFLETRF